MRLNYRMLKLTLMCSLVALSTGCNTENFFSANSHLSSTNPNSNPQPTPTPTSSNLPGPSCKTVLLQTTQNLNILFMVDNSGSTATTDPNHYYRAQTISNFIQTYGSKQNFTYSFGMFSTNSKVYDVNQANFVTTPVKPFGSATDLSNALQILNNTPSSGSTNYVKAFDSLQNVITNDFSNSQTPHNYIIIFMSDGAPTDLNNPAANAIKTATQSLVEYVHNHGQLITVNSVYFGPETGIVDQTNNISAAQAIANLKAMAESGSGYFTDTNLLGGGTLNIDDSITVPGEVCTSN